MHIIAAILSILGIAMFWLWRARQAREAAGEVMDAANDVRLAAKRFLYKRKRNTHPADCVDDARLAAAGIVVAVATLDTPISQAEIKALTAEMRKTFDVNDREALDLLSFGRWVAGQCNTNEEAVRRLSKRVATLAGPEALPDLLRMVETVATADGRELDEMDQDCLRIISQALSR